MRMSMGHIAYMRITALFLGLLVVMYGVTWELNLFLANFFKPCKPV
jgi:hypothetical protein